MFSLLQPHPHMMYILLEKYKEYVRIKARRKYYDLVVKSTVNYTVEEYVEKRMEEYVNVPFFMLDLHTKQNAVPNVCPLTFKIIACHK